MKKDTSILEKINKAFQNKYVSFLFDHVLFIVGFLVLFHFGSFHYDKFFGSELTISEYEENVTFLVLFSCFIGWFGHSIKELITSN